MSSEKPKRLCLLLAMLLASLSWSMVSEAQSETNSATSDALSGDGADDANADIRAEESDANADTSPGEVPDAGESEPGAPTAEAAPPSEEDVAYATQIERALEEFAAGQYLEAVDHFRAAYALRPSARVLRGLGKAYFELGEYVEASTAFERALNGTDALEGALQQEVEELLARSEQHIAFVEMHVQPESALVRVQGRELQGPRVRVNAGDIEIFVDAPGHLPQRHTVRLESGERRRFDITLDALSSPSESHAASYVAGSLALASIAGTIAGGFWVRDRLDARGQCDASGLVCTNQSRIETERNAAIVVTSISGLLALSSSIWFALSLRGDEQDTLSLSCSAAPACTLRGSF